MMKNRIIVEVRDYDQASHGMTPRICKSCKQPATKDVLFNAGNGIMVIERYCDCCSAIISKNNDNYKK